MGPVRKRKVLFVDDEKHWRDRATASLSAAGFEVLTAADGSEAMSRGTDPSLSLMIVDEDLAGESGSMLTWFLRHNNPDVPAILYTGTGRGAHAASGARNRGADQCLPKGSMAELVIKVGHLFQ
jgi:DNA-binding response OmpR family regulator